MQNQENSESKKLTKQEYNKIYYKMNKHRWNGNKKDRPQTNVFQLFTNKGLESSPIASLGRWWIPFLHYLEFLILLILVGILTTFLIREAAGFYLDAQESPLAAYLKAGLMEGTAILFSLSRGKHQLLKWAQRIVAVILCLFTLFVMSGKLVKTASGDTSKIEVLRQNIQQLESELSQKEQLRIRFLSRGRLTVAKNYEKGIDLVREKIINARQQLSAMETPQVVATGLGILISFRVLLVIINLICIHRIVEHLESLSEPEKGQKVIGKELNFLS